MLYSILEMLFRHRWRYLALIVVLPLIGAAVCIPLFPKSTATESIWVQDQSLLGTTQPTYDSYLTPAQIAQADLEQYIQTQTFANGVKDKLLSSHVVSSTSEATTIAGGLSSNLTATAAGNNLLVLYYTCSQASLCPSVLGTSLTVYEQYSANNAENQLKVAQKAYQQQLNQSQSQLTTANAAVRSYLSQHPGETQQTTDDPALTTLLNNVSSAQQTVESAQAKLAQITSQAGTTQISAAALYQVVDAPHTSSSHLKSLPTKEMLIVAVAFWAIAAISLLLSARISRVVRHPNQLERALGIQVAAVMEPIPPRGQRRARAPQLQGGAGA